MYPALPDDAERQVHAPAARCFLAQPLQHDALVWRQCVHQELVVAHRVVAQFGERAACGGHVLEPLEAGRDMAAAKRARTGPRRRVPWCRL